MPYENTVTAHLALRVLLASQAGWAAVSTVTMQAGDLGRRRKAGSFLPPWLCAAGRECLVAWKPRPPGPVTLGTAQALPRAGGQGHWGHSHGLYFVIK